MDKNKSIVKISADFYAALLETQNENKLLVKVLFDNATLSWDKKRLNIDSEAASALLKAIRPGYYDSVMEELKDKEIAKA